MSSPSKVDEGQDERPSTAKQHVSEAAVEKGKETAEPGGQGGSLEEDTGEKEDTTTLHPQPTEVEGQEDEEGEIPYPEPDSSEPLHPPPDFRPFFTLIEDDSGDHHHPTVHYIFADDEDTDILTNAALQTLNDAEQPTQDTEPNERFVLLDLDPTGKEIVSAVSLSPDWQDLKTQLSPAPSWGGSEEKSEKGLMLRVSGKEARKVGGGGKGSVEGLMRVFDEGLRGLDGVLGACEKDTQDVKEAGGEEGVVG